MNIQNKNISIKELLSKLEWDTPYGSSDTGKLQSLEETLNVAESIRHL